MHRFTTPKISVILPVYNQEEFLKRSVSSVLKQTFKNWQLIIVNDGSSDASLEIARELAKQSEKIKVLNLKHAGVSAAINVGFKVADGDYITTLAADDYYLPSHLASNARYLAGHSKVDLVMSKTKTLGSKLVMDLEIKGKLINLDECAIGGTFFVKRKVFAAVGGRSKTSYGTDYFFAQKVLAKGFITKKRNTRTYVYDRRGEGSITKIEEARQRLK